MRYVDHPTAAYLYVVSLDPSGLAWEYLRRNPGYRADCAAAEAGGSTGGAEPWGLRSPRES